MKIRKIIIICLMVFSMNACLYIPAPVTPVKADYLTNSKTHDTLLILIPGIHDDEKAFAEQGFYTALKEANVQVDVVAAYVHIGYLLNDSFVERIENDIVQPAKAEGYKNIWIVGVSLGAYFAVNFMKAHPDDISGLLLLGPFLGKSDDIKTIMQAGGIRAWRPNTPEFESLSLKMWAWLKQESQENKLNHVYLGYGTHDRFIVGTQQLAELLPQNNVRSIEGGHDWVSWLALWKQFLQQGLFKN